MAVKVGSPALLWRSRPWDGLPQPNLQPIRVFWRFALGSLVALSHPTLSLAAYFLQLELGTLRNPFLIVDTPFLRPFHFNVNIPQVTIVSALIKIIRSLQCV